MVKERLKVLIITTFYPPSKGGIQTYTYEIAKNLRDMGDEVTVFSISSDGIRKIFSDPFMKVYKGENEKVGLLHVLKPHDCILATTWFPSGLVGIFLSRLHHVPLYISAHGNEILYPESYPLMEKLMIWTFNRADKIFAVSNYTKSLLVEKGVPREKIYIVPNGTDPERFSSKVTFDDILQKHGIQGKRIILSISRLVERKNLGAVIRILPEILEKFPDVVYLIGGEGPMKDEWKRLAHEKGIGDKVMFVGRIPDDELPKYYAMCDIFVMPSKKIREKGEVEGFGIAFLEANACGKPVIGGRSGGVEDAIIDGETGILVDPDNENELKEAITKLLSDDSIAHLMGRKGRKRIEEELNWRKVTERLRRYMIVDKVR